MTSPSPALRPRVALFVDGENLPSSHAGRLVVLAGKKGDLIIKRVYGNLAQLNGWQAAPGFRVIHSGTGKNATDMLVCVEVMHVALNRLADLIVIATSDRDYSHLATYLREASIAVHGIGEAEKAPEALRKAFSGFDAIEAPAKAAPPQVPRESPAAPTALDSVVDIVGRAGPGGAAIHTLNPVMHRAGFRISQQPEKTWRKWLEARSDMFQCDPRGPDAHVRLRQPEAAPRSAP